MKKGKHEFDEWEARDAARALIQAETVKRDERPGFKDAVGKALVEIEAEKSKEAAGAKVAKRLQKFWNKARGK